MESNLKYRKAFLIIAYVMLVQFILLPLYQFPTSFKVIFGLIFIGFIFCLHTLKLMKYWVQIFYVSFFSFALLGQYFIPGLHFLVIQFMFFCALVFDGFSWPSVALLSAFLIESLFMSWPREISMYATLISSWMISVALEKHVSRMKMKQGFLDRKLRYKGIKTDLFMHELKNQIQPLMFTYSDSKDFDEVVQSIMDFSSFDAPEELSFEEVVMGVKEKFNIDAEIEVTGKEDFFIDQLDLRTILSNLMKNSQNASKQKGTTLHIKLANRYTGFTYEDNAGGMTSEQYDFFQQKELKPYVDSNGKKGLGLLLIRKLLQHHGSKFLITSTSNGTSFKISY